ncbi:hypothetical protein [Streptomyces olivaceoviridis]
MCTLAIGTAWQALQDEGRIPQGKLMPITGAVSAKQGNCCGRNENALAPTDCPAPRPPGAWTTSPAASCPSASPAPSLRPPA